MLALRIGKQERRRNAIQDVSRRCTAASLFEPGIPGGTDIGPLRDIFAPKPGVRRREAEKPSAAGFNRLRRALRYAPKEPSSVLSIAMLVFLIP